MIDPQTLDDVISRYQEVLDLLATPEVATDPEQLEKYGREEADLKPAKEAAENYRKLLDDKEMWKEMADGEEGEEAVLARAELEEVEERLRILEKELQDLLAPKDPEDKRDAIIEIRAGAGGDEAALFAGDLFDLYRKVADSRGWSIEVMDVGEGTMGGYKEVTFAMKGKGVFGEMKFESGVHRVQRVPATESQGRIHTSAASVAVLPEAEEVDVSLHPNDLRVDVYRSSGPGGQSVNTTDSAVRLTHIPTGVVVSIQDEKSQHKNKEKALRVLRSRLYQMERERVEAERSEARREMVGSGDRSAKIRTYNWPQGRVTDHRLEGDDKNHALQDILDGNLEPIHNALKLVERDQRLASL